MLKQKPVRSFSGFPFLCRVCKGNVKKMLQPIQRERK
jgi:hypothetical protein